MFSWKSTEHRQIMVFNWKKLFVHFQTNLLGLRLTFASLFLTLFDAQSDFLLLEKNLMKFFFGSLIYEARWKYFLENWIDIKCLWGYLFVLKCQHFPVPMDFLDMLATFFKNFCFSKFQQKTKFFQMKIKLRVNISSLSDSVCLHLKSLKENYSCKLYSV